MSYLELSFELGELDPAAAESACYRGRRALRHLQRCRDEPVLEPRPGEVRLWRRTRLQALYDAAGADAGADRRVSPRRSESNRRV